MLERLKSARLVLFIAFSVLFSSMAAPVEAGNRVKFRGTVMLLPSPSGGMFPVDYKLTINEKTGRVRLVGEGSTKKVSSSDVEMVLNMYLSDLIDASGSVDQLIRLRVSVNKRGNAKLVAVFKIDPSLIPDLVDLVESL